ncbi:MAG TPA: hypothetical protein VE326_12485 [Candidatus Binatia bacterium]|nr:hypothetical protein [Candidatus Binatia bacterium]
MTHSNPTISGVAAAVLSAAVLLFTPACQRSGPGNASKPDSVAVARADSVAVRHLVLTFGTRLNQVSLLAPDSARARAMQAQYGGLVSPALLKQWAADPRHAAGRFTSSPWPDHIEIGTVERKSSRVYLVDGEIVERTSTDSSGASGRIPVQIGVWRSGRGWMIQNYDQGLPGAGTADLGENDPAFAPERAVAVVRAYYDAINAGRFQNAYRMWESDGAASGKSMIEFLNGYAQTKSVDATIGTPGPMGAAAGSRYVDVPVHLVATTVKGAREAFSGTITLRRSVVDGATAKQRTWQIYSAKIKKEPAA